MVPLSSCCHRSVRMLAVSLVEPWHGSALRSNAWNRSTSGSPFAERMGRVGE